MENRETMTVDVTQDGLEAAGDARQDPLDDITIQDGRAPCLVMAFCGYVRNDAGMLVGVVCPMCGRDLMFTDGELEMGGLLAMKCQEDHQVNVWFGRSDDRPVVNCADDDDADGMAVVRAVEYQGGPEVIPVIQGDDCDMVRNNWGVIIGVRCPVCETTVIAATDRMADPGRDAVRDELEETDGREVAEQWVSSIPQVLECPGCHSLIATYGWMR